MKTLTDICLEVFAESLQPDLQSSGDALVLKNVKVCGLISGNGRVYPESVLAEAVQQGLYTNVPLCIESSNHKDGVPHPGKHLYGDRLGCLVNPSLKPGSGVFGDARLNSKHPLAEAVAWDYQNKTKGVGLSQTGFFQLDPTGKTILSVAEIKSIDIVTNPATTVSLVESEQDEGEGEPTKQDGQAEQAADKSTVDDAEMEHHITRMLAHPKFTEYMSNFAKGLKAETAEVEPSEQAAAEALQRNLIKTVLTEVLQQVGGGAGKPRSVSPLGDFTIQHQPAHWSEQTLKLPVKYKP